MQWRHYGDLEDCEEGLGEVELQYPPGTGAPRGGDALLQQGIAPNPWAKPAVYNITAVAGGVPPADIKAYRPPEIEEGVQHDDSGPVRDCPVKTPLL